MALDGLLEPSAAIFQGLPDCIVQSTILEILFSGHRFGTLRAHCANAMPKRRFPLRGTIWPQSPQDGS